MLETKTESEIIDKLNHLLELDYDAIAAYQAAIDRLENSDHRAQLEYFKQEHERHVALLSNKVVNMGGTPKHSGDAKKLLAKGKVVVADLSGDAAVLKAMRSNEAEINELYAIAVEDVRGLDDIYYLLNQNFQDEKKHKYWLEGILNHV